MLYSEILKAIGPKREDFLKSLETGNDVCIINFGNSGSASMINSLFGNPFSTFQEAPKEEKKEIVLITTVQGILDDGTIIANNTVFSPTNAESITSGEKLLIIEPTETLRERATFLKNADIIKSIDWEKIANDAMGEIVQVINRRADEGTFIKPPESDKKSE